MPMMLLGKGNGESKIMKILTQNLAYIEEGDDFELQNEEVGR